MKKLFGILLIAVVVVGILLIVKDNTTPLIEPIVSYDLSSLDVFSKPLSESGIRADSIGFTSFSPSGHYFMFVAFNEAMTLGNQTFVVDLSSGSIVNPEGVPQRGFTTANGDTLELFTSNGLVLYDPKNDPVVPGKAIPNSKEIFGGALSPNGNYFIMNGSDGVSLYDMHTKSVREIGGGKYDGAHVWFSDNARILGYRETDENLFEAGKGRELGIWNIDGTFSKFPIEVPVHVIGLIEWVVPEKIARVNAGYDDGSFDYLINLEANTVASLGDTSGAIIGGIEVDVKNGVVGVLGAFEGSANYLKMFGSDGALLYKMTLDPLKLYKDLQIVSKDEVLYLESTVPSNGVGKDTLLVRHNLKTNQKSILKTFTDSNFVSLSLHPDHVTWIVSDGTAFSLGKL